ncbi:MAG TPA: hypothetical protein VMD05_00405 [Candidatus Nanoarchaeia archaeon]|nr:hypothetical protein [Candidatus Nanoarchaeia archaeon]
MRDAPVKLSSPCDACGHPVGGGLNYCPKCKIALCNYCSTQLMLKQNGPTVRTRCPMCGEYFPDI